MFTYADAINQYHPTVTFTCEGDLNVYENYVATDEVNHPIPPKATLDSNIRAMVELEQWRRIQDERTRRQNGGVYIASVNKWFHSDQTSRIQQLGLVMMGANLPNNINWKTMDGSFIVMTPAIALSIFNAAATLDMAAFAVAEQHRANMIASANPANYDFSGFWPAIYGG